jgi:Skp family chaperone for outer membrane proteins
MPPLRPIPHGANRIRSAGCAKATDGAPARPAFLVAAPAESEYVLASSKSRSRADWNYARMKRTLMTVIALACLNTALSAEARIATINLRRVFDGYWKTKVASSDLRGRTEEYDQDFRKLLEQYQKANEAYRQLVMKYTDVTTPEEEKKKLEVTARAKVGELREMEAELNQFLQHSRTMIGEKQQRLRASILNEINVVVTAKARAGNYDLVLDTSGESSNNIPTVAYTSGKNDLTDVVLEELNTTAPPEITKPESPTKPATPPADANKEEKKEEPKPASEAAKPPSH